MTASHPGHLNTVPHQSVVLLVRRRSQLPDSVSRTSIMVAQRIFQ
jgi:hypothetical protein